MVQRQLCSLDDLKTSQFGRPFPRHGLQLLFWFAKDCVTCELTKCVVVVKLVSDCNPGRGCFGFHWFGNVEELLPVLVQPAKRKNKVAYYEVGNLNKDTYPASDDLPTYVTQNYVFKGDNNSDRIIIRYQARSRVVDTIYVTKHSGDISGSFSLEDTFEISSELIQALQSLHMDVYSFLTDMGFYQDIPVVRQCDEEEIHDQAEQMFDVSDSFEHFFLETFNQKFFNMKPFGDENREHCYADIQSLNSRTSENYNYGVGSNNSYKYFRVQHGYRAPTASNTPRSGWQSDTLSWPQKAYKDKDSDDKDKKSRSGYGITLVKILLGAGALILAVKCFSWMRSSSTAKAQGWILSAHPSYQHRDVMLDYVF